MTFTYDVTTDAGLVRLLIADTDLVNTTVQVFQDAEIAAFLSLNAGNVLLAAAQALDAMARSEVMIDKVTTMLDLSVDGAAVARELRMSADKLREQYASGSGSEEGLFDYAEMVFTPFGERERLFNQALREAV